MKKPIVLSLLIITLMAGACSSPSAESTSTTEEVVQETPQIEGLEVTYNGDSIAMKGYVAYDKSIEGPRPGVMIVHEWWGHNEHTRNAARKLAEAGYIAFAVDMYGDGKTAEHPEDAGAFAGAVMQNFDGAAARFNAGLSALQANPMCDPQQIAAVGYCFGGGVVLNLARQGADLDAVATFHGSIGAITPATPGTIKGKILVMNGQDDPFVSAEAIEAFKSEMETAGATYEFVNYPGAVHAFTNPEATAKGEQYQLPLAYNETADQQSWQKLLTFLDGVFK